MDKAENEQAADPVEEAESADIRVPRRCRVQSERPQTRTLDHFPTCNRDDPTREEIWATPPHPGLYGAEQDQEPGSKGACSLGQLVTVRASERGTRVDHESVRTREQGRVKQPRSHGVGTRERTKTPGEEAQNP